VRPDGLFLGQQLLASSAIEALLLYRAGVRQIEIAPEASAAEVKRGLNVMTDNSPAGLKAKLPEKFLLDKACPFTNTVSGHFNRLTMIARSKAVIAFGYAAGFALGLWPLAVLAGALHFPPILLVAIGPLVHYAHTKITVRKAAADKNTIEQRCQDPGQEKELARHLVERYRILADKAPDQRAAEIVELAFGRTPEAASLLESVKRLLLLKQAEAELAGRSADGACNLVQMKRRLSNELTPAGRPFIRELADMRTELSRAARGSRRKIA
jgi:hypothetical protein